MDLSKEFWVNAEWILMNLEGIVRTSLLIAGQYADRTSTQIDKQTTLGNQKSTTTKGDQWPKRLESKVSKDGSIKNVEGGGCWIGGQTAGSKSKANNLKVLYTAKTRVYMIGTGILTVSSKNPNGPSSS